MRGKDLVSYVKDFTKKQKITSVLNALEVEGKELTELSSWIKEFDQSNDKTIQEIVEHIFTAKLERDIPKNLQEIMKLLQKNYKKICKKLRNFCKKTAKICKKLRNSCKKTAKNLQ